MMPTDQRNDAEIVCEGFPNQWGCPNVSDPITWPPKDAS